MVWFTRAHCGGQDFQGHCILRLGPAWARRVWAVCCGQAGLQSAILVRGNLLWLPGPPGWARFHRQDRKSTSPALASCCPRTTLVKIKQNYVFLQMVLPSCPCGGRKMSRVTLCPGQPCPQAQGQGRKWPWAAHHSLLLERKANSVFRIFKETILLSSC